MWTDVNDLRAAVRQWRRTPLVTMVALASLTLGIGANTALFSLVDALLLRDLPVRDPAQLVQITGEPAFGIDVWRGLHERQPVFADVFAAAGDRLDLGRGGEARYASTLIVSGNFFDAIGVRVTAGRPLDANDDRRDAAPVAVITERFRRDVLGGAPDVLGRELSLDGQPFAIVGVADRRFTGIEVGRSVDVIVAIGSLATVPSRALFLRPSAYWLMLFGRLRPGQTLEQARGELRAWQPTLAEATRPSAALPGLDPRQHLATPLDLAPAANGVSPMRALYGRAMLIVLGVVGLVLLVACVNLAALVLARFADRQDEWILRRALGAGTRQIVRSQLVEIAVLAAAGAAMGLLFAAWLIECVVPYLTLPAVRGVVPQLDARLDGRALAATAMVVVVATFVAGLPAIWTATRRARAAVNVQTARSSSSYGPATAMRGLLVVQIAVSVVLVTSALLFVRSFTALLTQDVGFDRSRVLVVTATGDFGQSKPDALARIERLRARLAGVAGVEGVSASPMTPISGIRAEADLAVPGYQADDRLRVALNRVLPDHLRVYGTPLLRGRDLAASDGAEAPLVAVVNETFAERYLADRLPLGETIVLGGRETVIVGVAADARQARLRDAAVPFVYAPLAQWSFTRLSGLRFSLRTSQPDAVRVAVVSAFQDVDPTMTLELRSLAEDVNRSLNVERLLAYAGGLFGALALTIGVIGLYGTLAYAVLRRRREIGVRMAIGADRRRIVRLIVRDAVVILALGVPAGVVASRAVATLFEHLLYGTTANDPGPYAMSVTLLVLAAVLASLLPATQASHVDPSVALRDE